MGMPGTSRRYGLIAGALAATLLVPLQAASAAAVGLDPTFGNGGTVRFDSPDAEERGKAVAATPSGGLVVAAVRVQSGRDSRSSSIEVRRVLGDGSPDPSFGGGSGLVVWSGDDSGEVSHEVSDVLVGADGSITVIGSLMTFYGPFAGPQWYPVAFRLLADGSVDGSFGTAGAAYGPNGERSVAAATAGGKITVVTDVDPEYGGPVSVTRFTATGALDSAFAGDGTATVAVAGRVRDIVVTPAGIVFGAGISSGDFVLFKVGAAGRPDAQFGTGGVRRIDLGQFEDASTIALVNGKLVVGGIQTGPGSTQHLVLLRMSQTGVLDTTFSDDGKAFVYLGSTPELHEIATGAGGRLLLLASHIPTPGGPTKRMPAMARLLVNGALDTGFSGDGKAALTAPAFDEIGAATAGSNRAYWAGTTQYDVLVAAAR